MHPSVPKSKHLNCLSALAPQHPLLAAAGPELNTGHTQLELTLTARERLISCNSSAWLLSCFSRQGSLYGSGCPGIHSAGGLELRDSPVWRLRCCASTHQEFILLQIVKALRFKSVFLGFTGQTDPEALFNSCYMIRCRSEVSTGSLPTGGTILGGCGTLGMAGPSWR